jgi:hypothetical protein
VTPDKDIVVYCRIAERSSHSWFVLKYLLGYPRVKNYDGSWTEWGEPGGGAHRQGGGGLGAFPLQGLFRQPPPRGVSAQAAEAGFLEFQG